MYRVMRDGDRLNVPNSRLGPFQSRFPSLPLRLHYLVTPFVRAGQSNSAELEQRILGKVMQTLHDHARFRGADLQGDLSGRRSSEIHRVVRNTRARRHRPHVERSQSAVSALRVLRGRDHQHRFPDSSGPWPRCNRSNRSAGVIVEEQRRMTSRQTVTVSRPELVPSRLDARLRAGRIVRHRQREFYDEHTGNTQAAALDAFTVFPKRDVPGRRRRESRGLTGIPGTRVAAKLRTEPYDIDFTVTARRYLPFSADGPFHQAAHVPRHLHRASTSGVSRLHRESVELSARVVRVTAAGNVPARRCHSKHHGILAA